MFANLNVPLIFSQAARPPRRALWLLQLVRQEAATHLLHRSRRADCLRLSCSTAGSHERSGNGPGRRRLAAQSAVWKRSMTWARREAQIIGGGGSNWVFYMYRCIAIGRVQAPCSVLIYSTYPSKRKCKELKFTISASLYPHFALPANWEGDYPKVSNAGCRGQAPGRSALWSTYARVGR